MSNLIENPFAVIYSIPPEFASRVFDHKKSVIVKYSSREVISERLMSCKKILVYEPGSGKSIIGECNILSIELMTFLEVFPKYKNSLFLNEDELRTYSVGRDEKRMLVFKINNIKKYPVPIILDHSITMSGEYISEDTYQQLMKEL